MVSELKADQDIVIATARSAFPAAELAGDQATMDLITQRLNAHETHAWMLRATLGET
jgi:starvation-inducible DNA-binding protein